MKHNQIKQECDFSNERGEFSPLKTVTAPSSKIKPIEYAD